MGKDEFGLKGVITEHRPDPRILQASDPFAAGRPCFQEEHLPVWPAEEVGREMFSRAH